MPTAADFYEAFEDNPGNRVLLKITTFAAMHTFQLSEVTAAVHTLNQLRKWYT